MHEFLIVLRYIDFVGAFICFLILMYRGVFKLIVDRSAFSWDRLMNLIWCFVVTFGLGELLLEHVDTVGIRGITLTLAIGMQLYVLIFRSPFVDLQMVVPRKYSE